MTSRLKTPAPERRTGVAQEALKIILQAGPSFALHRWGCLPELKVDIEAHRSLPLPLNAQAQGPGRTTSRLRTSHKPWNRINLLGPLQRLRPCAKSKFCVIMYG